MAKIMKEFKEFAVRGNAVDMAVGIVVGAGFTALVNSFVKDVLMPPLGILTGPVDFADKVITLKEATATAEAITITYGEFISQIIDFVIIAFAVFLLVRTINTWQKAGEVKKEKPTPTTAACNYCKSIISKEAVKCPQCTANNPFA